MRSTLASCAVALAILSTACMLETDETDPDSDSESTELSSVSRAVKNDGASDERVDCYETCLYDWIDCANHPERGISLGQCDNGLDNCKDYCDDTVAATLPPAPIKPLIARPRVTTFAR